MNLTKLFVAGMCLTAMSASAAFVVATNDFEDGTLKGSWSGGVTALNITNGVVGITDGSTPIIGVGDTKVLKLDTEGAVWTNTVSESFESTDIYADMLVKFVPSETLPELANGKLALAVKANAGGTNMLNVANNNGSTFTWAETVQEISTTDWYRVTVKLNTVAEVGTYAQVYINNVAVGSLLDLDGETTLNSIGFQGTGYIDEVAVRNDDPFGAAVDLTLSFASGIASVYVGETQKFHNDTVSAPATLVITAAQWNEIASVTGPSTVTWVSGAVGSSVATVTVDHASATTVSISSRVETSTDPIGGATLFNGESATNVAAWARNNTITTLTDGIYNNYLLNISTNSLPTLDIKSIVVTNSTVTVTVEATGVNFSNIYGTLLLKAYPVLGGTPTNITATVSGTTTATVQADIGTNKFVKARVE
jgi:hypothetical protein